MLDEIDFELELTVRDIINFDYIIQLIAGLKDVDSDSVRQKKADEILRIFDRDVQLRKKKELVRKFIEDHLPKMQREEDVEKAFTAYWDSQRADTLKALAEDEQIPLEKLELLIGDYLYTQKLPRGQDIVSLLPERPPILKRQGIIERIQRAIENIIDIFEW